MERPGEGFIEVNEITDIMGFLRSIDWRDSWLFVMIAFHIGISLLSFLSRNMVNFQVVLFLSLLLLVYCSEFLNEVAAKNWHKFSKQQYFDANGLFTSIIFSSPILVNCIFLLARFIYQNMELMAKVKRVQIRQQLKQRQSSVDPSVCSGNENRPKVD